MARKKYPEALETGNRIKAARIEKGLSMEQLGEKLTPPASKGAVSNWENGYNLPNNARLKQLSDILDVSTSYLLEGRFMLRDVHLMPREEQDKHWAEIQRNIDDARSSTLTTTRLKYTNVNWEGLSDAELLIYYHFVRFFENYRKMDSGSAIGALSAILGSFNMLHDEYIDPKLSIDYKKERIDLYINDIASNLPNDLNQFAVFLKDELK